MLILPLASVPWTCENPMTVPPHPLLNPDIPLSAYRAVDLSADNPKLAGTPLDARSSQDYLSRFLKDTDGLVAYGGYFEKRSLYRDFGHFDQEDREVREFHLGIDLWAPEGTSVHAPWDGRLHSWSNRRLPGDYGPVILLEHQVDGECLFALYGHLSEDSLTGLFTGKSFKKGGRIARLGLPEENGGYAPHLHFQLIRDLQGNKGDYPGVCSLSKRPFYRKNCPDPLAFLKYF